MKSIALILAPILFAQGLHAQEKRPWDIDRLCGKIEHAKKIPDRKNVNTFSEKRKALRDVPLTLYEQRDNEPCCSNLNAIETTRTRRGGNFEFKTKKPGNFWLRINWNGKEYKLAVVYKPQKNSTTICSEQGLGLDDEENANWWVTVTVD